MNARLAVRLLRPKPQPSPQQLRITRSLALGVADSIEAITPRRSVRVQHGSSLFLSACWFVVALLALAYAVGFRT